MPLKSQTIAQNWEHAVTRKLGDLFRRVRALELRSSGAQRQIFLYFPSSGSLPFTWQANRHNIVITTVHLDAAGAVAFTKNGTPVVPPITVIIGDRIVLTASGVGIGGLGVTLTEDWPYQ
jgi:hypothetical protein